MLAFSFLFLEKQKLAIKYFHLAATLLNHFTKNKFECLEDLIFLIIRWSSNITIIIINNYYYAGLQFRSTSSCPGVLLLTSASSSLLGFCPTTISCRKHWGEQENLQKGSRGTQKKYFFTVFWGTKQPAVTSTVKYVTFTIRMQFYQLF